MRVKFNPSDNSTVGLIKQKSAELIDICEKMKEQIPANPGGEIMRCLALAQTHYEDAAMWAVKAATAE